MDKKPKSPSKSLTILTDIIFPRDSNAKNDLFGGELLYRMDRIAGITARRHSGKDVTTASVNHVAFIKAIPVASILTIEASVSRTFTSSMEIYVNAWIDDKNYTPKAIKVAEGVYTLVAIDKQRNPIAVPPLNPVTELEKERYHGALKRKQLSLVLAGKLSNQEIKN